MILEPIALKLSATKNNSELEIQPENNNYKPEIVTNNTIYRQIVNEENDHKENIICN